MSIPAVQPGRVQPGGPSVQPGFPGTAAAPAAVITPDPDQARWALASTVPDPDQAGWTLYAG